MGQTEILKFLKKNKNKKFTEKEIKKALKQNTLYCPLKQLRKSRDLLFEYEKNEEGYYIYLYFHKN